MSFFSAYFLTGALIATLIVLFFLQQRERHARLILDACSNLLQEIFKNIGEPSSVTRILLQESPKQELKRLKYLLEHRTHSAFNENAILRRILGGLPDGVIALDDSANVLFSNQSYSAMVGISEDNHEGKKLFEILRHHSALTAAEKFLNQRTNLRTEIEFLTGSSQTIKIRMIRLEQESTPLIIFTFTDISDLKKLEVMRRDFVANVSHELRTPLTSIHGFIETLLDGAGEDKSVRDRFLGIIKTDAERLNRLIEDLLALSRIETQARHFEKQSLNVSEEADQVLELFSLRVQQKHLALDKKIGEEIILIANRDQFRQVLMNLLDNAVKFTPEHGQVSISASEQESGSVEMKISDSGVGIHPDNRDKIFQRFFREDKARSRETGGTGLGLAIVKHIMEAHQGNVRCEENPTGGTLFILQFPQK